MNKNCVDPTKVLQTAIEELDRFTQPEATRLEVGEDGRLVASMETKLERVVRLARTLIAPKEHRQQLDKLKQVILRARDIVKSHSALITKFQEGDASQQKFAVYVLEAIQRYNSVVAQNSEMKDHNLERDRLLLDDEIKGLPIELPHTFSIKYDSHPNHPAQERLKELSKTLTTGAVAKELSAVQSTHKKSDQFMLDTFRLKAIRMVQSHLSEQSSMAEIVSLVNHTPIEVHEESASMQTMMHQLLEIGPGSSVLLTGYFDKKASGSAIVKMPSLDSFRLSFQHSHFGFPYPSQHNGWALADKCVEANPLRMDQSSAFYHIEQRKKKLAHRHLYDQPFIQEIRRKSKLKREVFDLYRSTFLPMHRKLQEGLIAGAHGLLALDQGILDPFYAEAAQAPSAFHMIAQSQQQMIELFINQPIKALEEEWLEGGTTSLRLGTPQERLQAASSRLEQAREKAKTSLSIETARDAFILQQGSLLGNTFQAIWLQYQSEKMGFAPPLLSDFERKLQICAFQQLIRFLDECEHSLGLTDFYQIKAELLRLYSEDLHLIQSATSDDEDRLAITLANEIEVYFTSRYYAQTPRLHN